MPRQLLRQPPSALAPPGARESQHQTSLVGQRSGNSRGLSAPGSDFLSPAMQLLCIDAFFFLFLFERTLLLLCC